MQCHLKVNKVSEGEVGMNVSLTVTKEISWLQENKYNQHIEIKMTAVHAIHHYVWAQALHLPQERFKQHKTKKNATHTRHFKFSCFFVKTKCVTKIPSRSAQQWGPPSHMHHYTDSKRKSVRWNTVRTQGSYEYRSTLPCFHPNIAWQLQKEISRSVHVAWYQHFKMQDSP